MQYKTAKYLSRNHESLHLQGVHKMKAIQKFLVDMLEAWIEGRNQYLDYKKRQ
jgi:hypothetical protein